MSTTNNSVIDEHTTSINDNIVEESQLPVDEVEDDSRTAENIIVDVGEEMIDDDEIPIDADHVEIEVAIASDEDEIDVDGVHYPQEEDINRDPVIYEDIVTIMLGEVHTLDADAFVNFCMGNVHSGNDTFLQTHQLCGDELKNACHKFRGVSAGYARITDAFNLKNFKKIIHSILPMIETRFIGASPHLTFLAIMSALDCAKENNLKTIVITPPFAIEPNVACYLMLVALKKWKRENPNALESIVVVCENDNDFISFHHQIPVVDSVDDFSPENFDDFFPSLQYTTQECTQGFVEAEYNQYYPPEEGLEYNENEIQTRKVDMSMNVSQSLTKSDNMYEQRSLLRNIQLHADDPDTKEIHDLYQKMFYLSDGGIRLQLSRNLSPTMLPIEEPDGRIRQYRLTTQSRNGDAYYFRCSHCEFLSKKTETQYRPKMTVRDGSIQGSYYPMHHPECQAVTKRQIIVQQLDRQARCKIMDQNMMMRQLQDNGSADCEINTEGLKLPEEAAETAAAIAGASKVKFPTWEQVRKQYYRLRAKGEKLAAAGRRENHLPFVDAVPIMVQPDEKAITTDVIQRAERQFDAEAFGMQDEEVAHPHHNSRRVKHEVMYHNGQPVYASYATTSDDTLGVDEDGNEIIEEDSAEYYSTETSYNPKVNRMSEVIVKDEIDQDRHQAKRQMLGMPRYSSMVMSNADTRYNANRMTEMEQMAPELVLEEFPLEEEPQPQSSRATRASIMRKKPRVAIVPRRRRTDQTSPMGPPAKRSAVSPELSFEEEAIHPPKLENSSMGNERVRRSARSSQGRPPSRFV